MDLRETRSFHYYLQKDADEARESIKQYEVIRMVIMAVH